MLVLTVQTASDTKDSGIVMTIALTIEMAFLALSFSGALKDNPAHMKVFGAAIGPFALLLGGLVSCCLRLKLGMLLWAYFVTWHAFFCSFYFLCQM